MWLSSFLSKYKKVALASKGSITAADGKNLQVDTSVRLEDVRTIAPYGIKYVPPIGEDALVVPFSGGEVCVGVISGAQEDLRPGELMLCSEGGASIVLKNDGSVLINGRKVEN